MNRYASFFAAYNASVERGNPYSKEDLIGNFTGGRTTSLKELSSFELNELTISLNRMSGSRERVPEKYAGTKADRMRKSIIAIFHKMERTPQEAIAWAEKQGVRGAKKDFNDYTTGELYVLIGVAEKIQSDWMKALRRQMNAASNFK